MKAYYVWKYDLTAAPPSPGFVTSAFTTEKIIFIGAYNTAGEAQAGARVSVAFGSAEHDFIDLTPGDWVSSRPGQKVRIKWDAQASVSECRLLMVGNGAEMSFDGTPSATLVQSVGDRADALNFGAVAMSGTAAQIVAGDATRRGLRLCNSGAVAVFIGRNATVTAASGFWLMPGGTFETDDYTGAIWGITSGAAGEVRFWAEYVA
jgi:hypothetical protein